jgi:4-amino-4-deoxy-L-arabinose transferase-like glycosyltransferase
VYVAQIILQSLSCLLLYRLVQPYFGTTAATLAGLFLATDLMLAVSNVEAMSEPLFLFFTLASANCLLPQIIPPQGTKNTSLGLLVGGVLLGLAILTRPAGLYLPFVYGVLFLCFGRGQRGVLRTVGCAAVVMMLALVPAVAWIVRNSMVSSLNRLTNADAIMLVYFTGAGAYQVEHGLTLQEAQDRISKEFSLPPPEVTNNHWLSDQPVAEMDAQVRRAVLPVVLKYPRSLVISSATAVGKATLAHNVPALAHAMGSTWVAPGTAGLLKADGEAVDRLMQNGPMLVSVFVIQMGHMIVTCVLAAIGIVLVVREKRVRLLGLSLLLILAYFYVTVAMAGFEATYRSRTPHMPFLFVFAGAAAAILCGSRVRRCSRAGTECI